MNRDGGSADEYGHLLALSRFVTGEVIEGLTVTQDTGSNMAIRVQAGSARVPTGTSPGNYAYFVAIDTSGSGEQVTITTANSSNPRRDLIVAYVDKSVTPSTVTANNPGMLKLAAVAGTPAASPVDPTTSAIQSAIGAANPYIILARVSVAAAVTQITTANCTDVRTMAFTPQSPYQWNAYMTGSPVMSSPAFGKAPFNAVDFNIGSLFDTTNNRVTIRQPGSYHFDWTVATNQGSGSHIVDSLLKKNASTNLIRGAQGWSSAAGNISTGGGTRRYAAGDYVEVWVSADTSLGFDTTDQSTNTFSGFFVGP